MYKDIKDIKLKHGISSHREIKWTKVSNAKLDYYKELIHYFFSNESLNFRAVVIPDKSKLNHDKFSQTHDDFYYKMYFYLIRKFLNNKHELQIFMDIKDTHGNKKIRKLKKILQNFSKNRFEHSVKNIQLIRSHENSLLQLTDLLIGAISYKNRGLSNSNSKLELISLIEEYTNFNLDKTTMLSEIKFNIFIFDNDGGK